MGDPELQQRSRSETQTDAPKSIRCRRCGADVTVMEARISIDGSHEHFFRNPAGIRFRVACFAYAPGAEPFGEPTEEFTWFPPYRWQLALCRSCLAHLGWTYQGDAGESFFGLIVDRLRYPQEQ